MGQHMGQPRDCHLPPPPHLLPRRERPVCLLESIILLSQGAPRTARPAAGRTSSPRARPAQISRQSSQSPKASLPSPYAVTWRDRGARPFCEPAPNGEETADGPCLFASPIGRCLTLEFKLSACKKRAMCVAVTRPVGGAVPAARQSRTRVAASARSAPGGIRQGNTVSPPAASKTPRATASAKVHTRPAPRGRAVCRGTPDTRKGP